MKFTDTFFLQALYEFDRDIRGNHLPRFGIVIEPVELGVQPVRHCGTAGRGKTQQRGEIGNRQNARNNRRGDAGCRCEITEAQVLVGIEKELRDRAVRAGVELALEIIEIGERVFGFRMHFRIGRDRNFEISDLAFSYLASGCRRGAFSGNRPATCGDLS